MHHIDQKHCFIVIILCLFAFCYQYNYIEAAEKDIKVRPVEEEFFVIKPRSILSTSFRVTNNTDKTREFISRVQLPDGWTLITKDVPFELKSKASDIRLLSFFIPQTALAGKYQVFYLVKDREIPSLSGLYSIFVSVAPLVNIKVELLQAPENVVAGDSYRLTFLVTNESNIAAPIRTSVSSSEDYPFNMDTNEFELQPGESKRLHLEIQTDKDVQRGLKQIVHLTAEVVEYNRVTESFGKEGPGEKGTITLKQDKAMAHATASVGIVPRISFVEERYHKIPGEISFKWAMEEDETKKSGFQTKVSGMGKLDQEGKRDLEFLFKVSDRDYESIYWAYDEYFLSYKTQGQEIHIGDRAYSLSTLTENYLYGRGVEGEQSIHNYGVKAYHVRTRKFSPEETQTGARIDYLIYESHKIAINYLNKEFENKDEGIVSVYGAAKPIKDMEVEMEYAYGGQNDAYMLNLSGNQDRVSYYLKYIHADPNYTGNYTDMDLISGSLNFPLTDHLGMKIYFRQDKDNLLKDPQKGTSLLNRFYGLGANYHLRTGTRLSFDWRLQTHADRLPSPTTNYQEKSFRCGIGQSFKKLNIYTSVELSRIDDRLANQTSNSENYMLNALFRPTNRLDSKGYLYWKNNGNVTGETTHNLTTGFGISYRLLERTFLNLNFQDDHYNESELNKSFFETKLKHRLRNNHEISVFSRSSSYEDPSREDESIIMMEYSMPFGLPLRRKKSIGGIKGRIYDFETKEPLPNVILRLNGLSAVTDKKGEFVFPAVHPGTFYLSLDRTGIAPNKIPMRKTPIEICVKGGRDSFIRIPVARSASLHGRVILYQTENGKFMLDPNQKLVERGGMENLVVEMRRGSEIDRRLTDNKGQFEFEELPPGQWTLKIFNDHIPAYHYIAQDTITIGLEPGEKETLSIDVLPQKRNILFIEEGGTLIEEKGD